ncbi:6-hydroxymethylpterin diphosphokinase MptE-like protein [Clostridium lacusfryxellense]|uniref:6-hydroxymethylpterin diphosphokinase MptE-like protein n=1 Tax=Clostridium lacusfryxellense TaxID=205328 RepID=UPI001C0CB4F5|nr:6-hydroxymethylpterin diphosphokinase MptE-like protein [Clostridium lacusfryxellense]MBU3111032.1 DUF115 domain-containing protein [Clostridium lacusfryxellense]
MVLDLNNLDERGYVEMNEKRMLAKYNKLVNFGNETLGMLRYKIIKKKEYKLITLNEKYHNIHKGERCFVLGNGPSLNDQDLALLENEYVITVNQAVRNTNFKNIKTNYHFWADPVFFNLSPDKPEDMELLEVFKSLNTEDNIPKCFLPVQAKEFVRKFELDKYMDINYYNSKLYFHDEYNKDIDFTKFIPRFQTVVQWGIAFAIYMGFSEIYLLGCDSTGIITGINTALGKDSTDTYGYKVSQNEIERLKSVRKTSEIETEFAGWTGIFHLYKVFNEYCKKRNIKLVNCSGKTIIDSIPRENYEAVIAHRVTKSE